jgi:hypothetical protein
MKSKTKMKIFRWTDRIKEQTHRKVEVVMDNGGGPESKIWDLVEETVEAVKKVTDKA